MDNYILEIFAGDRFSSVLSCAKKEAIKLDNQIVEFEFNGIKCLVDKNTDETLLSRDYSTALKLDWKIIGPNCDIEYSVDIIKHLEEKEIESKALERKKIEQEAKQLQGRKKVNKLITGVKLELVDEATWDTYVIKNKDPYGKRCISYAEEWAKLMQIKIDSGIILEEIAKEMAELADYDGITGFMYGAAVNILFNCWKHGEALKEWHNKQYNYEGNGVVNPAILTLS